MTPIQFLLEHREDVLGAYEGSLIAAWRKLIDQIQIDNAMTENTFRKILKPFFETCRFFNAKLNELSVDDALISRLVETNDRLNETIAELNKQLIMEQELNGRLNHKVQELNSELDKCRLTVSDDELDNGLYESVLDTGDEGLSKIEEQVKSRLNILGWTVAKSGRYYRAFRKIKGRVRGVHLGKDLTDAETKIVQKENQLKA